MKYIKPLLFLLVIFLVFGFLSACDLFSIKPRANNDDPGSTDYTEPEMGIPRIGLIAEYLFDGSGSDTSIGGHDGIVYGATLTTDRFGNANSAYSFDGLDDYIDLGFNIFSNSEAETGTLSGWVRMNSTLSSSDYDYIFSNEGYFSIQAFDSGAGTVLRGHVTDTAQKFVTAENSSELNNWYNITLTWDGAYLRLFINGNQKGGNIACGSPTPDLLSRKTIIGSRFDDIGNRWHGNIDDIRVYSRALTEAEIQTIYNDGNWPLGPTTNSWAETTPFTNGRAYHETAAYNGFIYISGGADSSGSFNDVQYSKINTDGTLGTWNSGTSFTTARFDHNMEVYNGFIYIIGGGYNNGVWNYIDNVQYALLNQDGSLGTWTISPNTYTNARKAHESVVYKDFLYLLGGANASSGSFNDVQYVLLNADGSLGVWQTANSFNGTRYRFSALAFKDFMYIFGGSPGGGVYLSDVQYAPINTDGSLGSWKYTTSLPAAINVTSAVVQNGYLVSIGGATDTAFTTVNYAKINSDGSIGTWTSTEPLLLSGMQSVAVNNRFLYSTGGHDGTNYVNKSYFTEFLP